MAIVRALPELEDWLELHSDSWSALDDREYKALVRGWSADFGSLIAADASSRKGKRAIESLEGRLPADVYVFSGLQVPRVANMGGRGPAAYRSCGLRALDRYMANRLELIVVSEDFAWCCVFTHEAGDYAREHFFERNDDEDSIPTSDFG